MFNLSLWRIKATFNSNYTVGKKKSERDNIIHTYLLTLDGSVCQCRVRPTSVAVHARPPEMIEYRTREQKGPISGDPRPSSGSALINLGSNSLSLHHKVLSCSPVLTIIPAINLQIKISPAIKQTVLGCQAQVPPTLRQIHCHWRLFGLINTHYTHTSISEAADPRVMFDLWPVMKNLMRLTSSASLVFSSCKDFWQC